MICSFTFSLAAAQDESIDQIKAQFKWINDQRDFVITELNNEDYLDNMPDNGAQVKGYYKNDTLYKVIELFGPSYAIYDHRVLFME